MEKNNTDVDAEVNKIISESEEIKSSGASDQDIETSEETIDPVTKSEDDASERAQQRIRELLEENAKLKSKESIFVEEKPSADELKNFLDAVNDEPSRDLLQKFSSILRKELRKEFNQELNPVLEKVRTEKFATEYDQLEKSFPEIAPYKEQIKKTYMRNPQTNLDDVASKISFQVRKNGVKPLESARVKNSPERNKDIETKINELIMAGKGEEALKLAQKELKY
jgi:uncharacterized membrane protein YheB (UPF0754 family)